MRGHLQQVSSKLVAALLALFATAVYLLTMDRSASWWDCGEFIATSHLLGVGHPPGAPFYQLVAHCFTLLSFGHPMLVAPLSNALSALCGGLTVGVLYLTVVELCRHRFAAVIAALCYLFCDTAWFSAVESEVYAMAMLLCSLEVWLALRWRRTRNHRLLLLLSLLLGLGLCVHLMTLLTLPALLVVILPTLVRCRRWARVLPLAALFFVLGLTPYAIVPLRAAAKPAINEGNPATVEAFASYVKRDQYPKAPLYPRMWRERDSANYHPWTFGTEGVVGNVLYTVNYQLGYMYGRYLMYNFIGRENLKHGIVVVFIVPFLLGVWGLLRHRRRSRADFWAVMLLFLFGGVLLNLYLNHPCYEPRERDYAYILSFYAFALWIGLGASHINHPRWRWVLLLAPLLLAVGNWSDHDRHRCHAVHDISLNHLQSCDPDAILITLGDNDTFPLWYLQLVEQRRTDVSVHNVNLEGYHAVKQAIEENKWQRPVYMSQYFYERYGHLFEGRLRCEGFCWRVLPDAEGVDDPVPLQRHLRDSIEWHITPGEYLDDVSRRFLADWRRNTGSLPPSMLN